MSLLSKTGVRSSDDEKDVDDDITPSFIVGQESAACSTSDDDHSTALTIPTPKGLLDYRQTDVYCQRRSKLLQSNDFCFSMTEDGLECRKAPINGSLQFIVP